MHIELLKPHTHAGQHLAAGDRLELNEASARWLIAKGVARPVTPDAQTPAPSLKPSRRDGSAVAATSTGD
ncbi:DUF7210 family protein [Azohydromonas sediminis]|uniref:DUF7210 family protein n=1 Tax=Azohydromonas sediminis TaxID=2259674 RepID=UPI000E65778B|nr:hypothetical protein [Azohydromonas sediminis]